MKITFLNVDRRACRRLPQRRREHREKKEVLTYDLVLLYNYNMITELSPEQEALIPVYREKWRAIAFSTERIDREKAAEAIKSFYNTIGDKAPERVIFLIVLMVL